MKRVYLITIIFLSIYFSSEGQQSNTCKSKFDKLLKILKHKTITNNDINKSWIITKELYKINYVDYIDSTDNNTTYVSHSLTKVFSDICIKYGDSLGVDYYLRYMKFTDGSCEEERSFALERLFVKYPEIVFKQIGKNKKLLDHLSWGFINNRVYGAINPHEKEEFTAMTVYEKGPKPILNKNNYKKIFFKTNPSLKNNYKKYKYQIDFIFNETFEYLKTIKN